MIILEKNHEIEEIIKIYFKKMFLNKNIEFKQDISDYFQSILESALLNELIEKCPKYIVTNNIIKLLNKYIETKNIEEKDIP